MAIGDSSVGMLFTIKAKNQTKDEFDKAKKDVKDLADTAEQSGGSLGSLAQKLGLSSSAAGELGTALSGAAAGAAIVATAIIGVGTALFTIAKQASDFGSEINDASEKTGLAAETLSALKFAADQSGSSFEEITKGIRNYTLLVADAAKGSDEANAALKRLGIDPKKALQDLDGSLAQVIKRIYEAKPGFEQNALAADAFGKKLGSELIPTINTTKGKFGDFLKEAERLGVVLSGDAVRAAHRFGDQLSELKAVAQGVAFQFASGFMPAITKAMKEISGSTADSMKVWKEWGQAIGDIILRLTRGAKVAIAVLKDLFSLDYKYTATVKVLQENIDAYDADRREKDRNAYADSDNRPQWLKDQDKDIKKIGRASDEDSLNDQKDAAEKRRKEREAAAKAELAAQIQLLQNHLQNAEQLFDTTFSRLKETLIKTGDAEGFRKSFSAAYKTFVDEAQSIVPQLDALEKQQAENEKRTATEKQNVFDAQQQRRIDLAKKGVDALAEKEKEITAERERQSARRLEIE
jgi:hypothetical protein